MFVTKLFISFTSLRFFSSVTILSLEIHTPKNTMYLLQDINRHKAKLLASFKDGNAFP